MPGSARFSFRSWRNVLGVALGAALAGGTAIGVGMAQQAAPASAPANAPPANPAVPVMTTVAQRRDVPIDAEGVGTIQAYQSVLIRSRVDGQLMQVPVAEGQMVRKGDLIAQIDPRPYQAALDGARARQAQDAAQLANAQRDLVRYSSLSRQDFASRQQVDTQQALVNQDVATVQGDVAAVEAAQINLDYCSITSPVDGRVGLRLVDPGNLVHATDTTGIISITQVHPIALTFTLPQTALPAIQAGLAQGKLPVRAYSTDDRTLLGEGTLLTPDNAIDTTTGTIRLKAVFANQDNRLWPGQFVNAHQQLSIAHQAVTVAPAAIQHGPDGLYVYLVKPDNSVASQPVTVGYQTPQLAVVTAGLSGGETVVLSGQSRLQPGLRVAATPAPAAG
ncbi:MAG: efflux RND transporter periplasmic adaptor subunit [Acetobacteraceae bacterium]|nr:efflux RND transporter periplasmic adaptor subunit [Acetobacteraceae bacterium]